MEIDAKRLIRTVFLELLFSVDSFNIPLTKVDLNLLQLKGIVMPTHGLVCHIFCV